MAREGITHERYGHLGLHIISFGPGSNVPGERLQLVIYDTTDRVVRRLEQIRGRCIDSGYVDFLCTAQSRPAQFLWPLVDIAADGRVTELISTFETGMDMALFQRIVEAWVTAHGVLEQQGVLPCDDGAEEVEEAVVVCSIDGCDETDDIESSYCGSFCQAHYHAHLAGCEICRA